MSPRRSFQAIRKQRRWSDYRRQFNARLRMSLQVRGFMQKHLTPELRLEARLLKKFAKGTATYGAEIKIGGFSGMLIDTLVLYYPSFMETLRHASSWNKGTLLEIGKPEGIVSPKEKDPNVDLVVIDPVDPNRNLAAAVRPDKLWSFVAAGRQFLRNPGLWYFFPPEFKPKTRQQFAKRIDEIGRASCRE